MILGCDAAGIDTDGNEVVVHSVIASAGLVRRRDAGPAPQSAVGEASGHAGRAGGRCRSRNVVPKPAELSFDEAACLPTAWLTAYRMLFVNSGVRPGRPSWCRAPPAGSPRR